MSADSKKVVVAALAGNLAIAVCKFAAAFFSASTATLAEAVHSLADTGNQALLLLGMGLSGKRDDERYPFGRAAERYFWPFIVALMLFSVGGAFAIIEGVSHLLYPEHEELKPIAFHLGSLAVSFPSSWITYAVLGT